VGTSGEVFNSRPWVRAKFTERKIVKEIHLKQLTQPTLNWPYQPLGTRRVTLELGSDLFVPAKLEHSGNEFDIIRLPYGVLAKSVKVMIDELDSDRNIYKIPGWETIKIMEVKC